jgi:hypothetical protein
MLILSILAVLAALGASLLLLCLFAHLGSNRQ